MQWNIVFLGPVGSGKTTAISTISDIEVVNTDVKPSDGKLLNGKTTTTVGMDMGVIGLGNGDKLRLFGAPGQERFDFMWDILLEKAKGAIVFVDHQHENRVETMEHYFNAIKRQVSATDFAVVIAVTHSENDNERSLDTYRQSFVSSSQCTCSLCQPPVMWCDARDKKDVTAVVAVMTAMLESFHKQPEPMLHQRFEAYLKRKNT